MEGPRALYISELTWVTCQTAAARATGPAANQPALQWTTDDELRIVAEQAGVAHQLVPWETTFYEHKVNGKSRGTAYLEFQTPEAAMAMHDYLQQIEIYNRKPSVHFVPPQQQGNPFRIIPKDPKMARAEAAAAGRMAHHAAGPPVPQGGYPRHAQMPPHHLHAGYPAGQQFAPPRGYYMDAPPQGPQGPQGAQGSYAQYGGPASRGGGQSGRYPPGRPGGGYPGQA